MIFVMALAPLVVLSAGAASHPAAEVARQFQHATGRTVTIHVGTVGQIRSRIAGGAKPDVVIVSASAMKSMAAQHQIVPGSVAALGRNPMAVGVRKGTPIPDISTVAAFKNTLLKAKAVAAADPAAGASSGIYFAKLLHRLGIADAVAPKEKLTPGGSSCELVARGQADICVQNLTEIVPVKGVVVVGKLPKPIANSITYSAAVLRAAASPGAARQFVSALSASRNWKLWRAAGYDPP